MALGTIAELRATAALGHTPAALVERARSLIGRLGLPAAVDRAEVEAAWPFVASDKKRVRTSLKLPVVTAAGESHVLSCALAELRAALLAPA